MSWHTIRLQASNGSGDLCCSGTVATQRSSWSDSQARTDSKLQKGDAIGNPAEWMDAQRARLWKYKHNDHVAYTHKYYIVLLFVAAKQVIHVCISLLTTWRTPTCMVQHFRRRRQIANTKERVGSEDDVWARFVLT